MRMARRLGLLGGDNGLVMLSPGDWKFKYENKEYTWTTNLQPKYSSYLTTYPYLDANGNHVFKTPGEGNYVAAAHSTVLIDLSKYTKIRIKYEQWYNASNTWQARTGPNASIELKRADVTDYYIPNREADIYIEHPNDPNPGEIVYTIPEAAKQTNPIRRIWVAAIRQRSSVRDGHLIISSITFER